MTGFVVAGIVLLLVILCVVVSLPLIHPRRVAGAHTPAEESLPYEDIAFTTSDGIQLHGWWIPADNASRAVILLHGYAGSMDPDLRYAPHLVNAGCNVLMFDFRAHCRSGGMITTLGALEVRDVQAAVAEVKKRGSQRLGLLGFSMGGRAAILAAPRVPGIDAVISDCAPPSLHYAVMQNLTMRKIASPLAWLLAGMMLIGGSLFSGRNLFRQDLLTMSDQVPDLPILFIQGGQDRYVRRDQLDRLVERCGSRARLWLVQEAKHRNVEDLHPDTYLETITHFFIDAL